MQHLCGNCRGARDWIARVRAAHRPRNLPDKHESSLSQISTKDEVFKACDMRIWPANLQISELLATGDRTQWEPVRDAFRDHEDVGDHAKVAVSTKVLASAPKAALHLHHNRR